MNHEEVYRLMKENREKKRGHADYFTWPLNRDQEEGGVVNRLLQSLEEIGANDLEGISIRGRGEDPPDCEAIDKAGARVAVEVTEFVDSEAIIAARKKEFYLRENEWSKAEYLIELKRLLENKANKKDKLLGAPYSGGYRVLVFCDEPELNSQNVSEFINSEVFDVDGKIDRAYFLLSYEPSAGGCPVFELSLK